MTHGDTDICLETEKGQWKRLARYFEIFEKQKTSGQFFFLLRPKNYHKLSLRVTFGDTFDNL